MKQFRYHTCAHTATAAAASSSQQHPNSSYSAYSSSAHPQQKQQKQQKHTSTRIRNEALAHASEMQQADTQPVFAGSIRRCHSQSIIGHGVPRLLLLSVLLSTVSSPAPFGSINQDTDNDNGPSSSQPWARGAMVSVQPHHDYHSWHSHPVVGVPHNRPFGPPSGDSSAVWSCLHVGALAVARVVRKPPHELTLEHRIGPESVASLHVTSAVGVVDSRV